MAFTMAKRVLSMATLAIGVTLGGLGSSLPVAHADPTGNAEQLQQEQAAKNDGSWSRIANFICSIKDPRGNKLKKSQEDMTDDEVAALYEAYKLSPLDFGAYDPYRAARRDALGIVGIKIPGKQNLADELRIAQWALCNVDEYRRTYLAELRSYEEKYGKKMKKGYEDDESIRALYDKKMEMYLTVIRKHNKDDDEDL
ncbi:hypothetical protein [Nocardia sp. NPDC051570]|uniref:hypothetical protein n=1 Tax=Nocardia sp. NPDC051570 TaxID=3364324 RepID=UPI0037967360